MTHTQIITDVRTSIQDVNALVANITTLTKEFCNDMHAKDLNAILGKKISDGTLENILNKNIADFTQGTPASSNDISRTAAVISSFGQLLQEITAPYNKSNDRKNSNDTEPEHANKDEATDT